MIQEIPRSVWTVPKKADNRKKTPPVVEWKLRQEVFYMSREYTKIEELVVLIEQRHEQGETYREIGSSLGLSREVVRSAMKRKRRKERKISEGYVPRPKGRPRKEPASEEKKQNNEIVQLRMQVELLRNFLLEAGRR